MLLRVASRKCTQGPPGNSADMQILKPHPDLLNPDLLFHRLPAESEAHEGLRCTGLKDLRISRREGAEGAGLSVCEPDVHHRYGRCQEHEGGGHAWTTAGARVREHFSPSWTPVSWPAGAAILPSLSLRAVVRLRPVKGSRMFWALRPPYDYSFAEKEEELCLQDAR